MTTKIMPLSHKIRATCIHLCVSIILFLMIASWIYLTLYPSFYFNMSGGLQGLWLMLGVDVILGPVLTFLVFNPNKEKREILTDFIIIGFIQLSALAYGMHTVYQERPKLVLMFDQGTATVLNAREVAENPKLSMYLKKANNTIETIPVSLNSAENGQVVHIDPLTKPSILIQLTQESRRFITQTDEITKLKAIESQHSQIYILSMMGKYTGAYIILDPQFNYLGKLGEKPIY